MKITKNIYFLSFSFKRVNMYVVKRSYYFITRKICFSGFHVTLVQSWTVRYRTIRSDFKWFGSDKLDESAQHCIGNNNSLLFITGIPEGGLVPKSFYMTPQEFEKDQSPGPHLMDNSCYHSISLSKGQVELIVPFSAARGTTGNVSLRFLMPSYPQWHHIDTQSPTVIIKLLILTKWFFLFLVGIELTQKYFVVFFTL